MGQTEEKQNLINNNNNDTIQQQQQTYNNKILVQKDITSSNNEFSKLIPREIYQYISPSDYNEIILQLNHYKKGVSVSVVGVTIISIFSVSLIAIAVILSIIKTNFGFVCLPIIGILIITQIIGYYRLKSHLKEEVGQYFSILNKRYVNLNFYPLYNQKGFLEDLEIYYPNTMNLGLNSYNGESSSSLSTPPNIYNTEIFKDFKYLQYARSQYYNIFIGNTIYNNNNNNNNNDINIIDIDNNQQTQQQQQQQQQPITYQFNNTNNGGRPQVYINNDTFYADDIQRPTIQDLLTPSDVEKFYTQQK